MHPLQKHIQQFVSITDNEFELIFKAAKLKRLKKNQLLLEQGQVCRADHFVLSGSLSQYCLDENGKERIVQFAFQNWWVSDWSSILSGKPSYYYIEALENTELLQIRNEDIENLFKLVPAFESYYRIIFQQAFAAHQSRIMWLQQPAVERYQYFASVYGYFEKALTQAQIASYLALTRESFSRVKRLIRNGVRDNN